MQRRLILASTSPRRKELLERTGLRFETVASDYEEDMTLALEPAALAKHLSRGKAEAVASRYSDAVILAADTFIAYEGRVLGKPHTAEKAAEMLKELSGRVHSIITGYTIIDTASGEDVSQAVETKVCLKNLSDKEVADYVATGEPLDKAGAYAIQGIGKVLVDHVEGDHDNAIGLPVADVVQSLEAFGVKAVA